MSDRPDSGTAAMVRKMVSADFGRPEIEVSAYGAEGDRERVVLLARAGTQVPVVPLSWCYEGISNERPPRLFESLEDWRDSRTGDLPQMVQRAIRELDRRAGRMAQASGGP